MAFTLGWRLLLPSGLRREQVREKVEALRQYCLGLPFERVTPHVKCLHGEELEEERRRGRNRWVWGDLDVPGTSEPREEYDRIEAREVVSFVVWPGRGAETGWFGVASHPDGDPRARQETGGNWYGSGFSKTLYAAHPNAGGLAHFMKCHLGLIATLDEARRLGFEGRVFDDGGYWEHRNVARLLEELHEAERRVASIVGRLSDLMADRAEGLVGVPMKGRPDFERIEAGASPAVTPLWDDDEVVMDLIGRTGGR